MIETVRARRSIRRFSAERIAPELIDELKESVLRAPSSRGLQSRGFVFVTDPELLSELSQSKPQFAGFLAQAALGVVVCGDPSVSDMWVEDCSIAGITLQLVAASQELGSCWIQIRNRQFAEDMSAEDRVRQILGLPESLGVECIIAVGHAEALPKPREREKLHWESITER